MEDLKIYNEAVKGAFNLIYTVKLKTSKGKTRGFDRYKSLFQILPKI